MERADIGSEIETRKAQRDILATFLKTRPGVVLMAEDLIAVIGPNYRSRVSQCVTELGMHIENVPRWREWLDKRGKTRRQRLIGGYRYLAHEPLGRDAGEQRPETLMDRMAEPSEWRLR